MGSVLKFIKGLGKTFMSMPTSTKLKMASGIAVLVGGIAIAAGAASDDSIKLLDGDIQEALPEVDNDEVIEVEPTMVETEE